MPLTTFFVKGGLESALKKWVAGDELEMGNPLVRGFFFQLHNGRGAKEIYALRCFFFFFFFFLLLVDTLRILHCPFLYATTTSTNKKFQLKQHQPPWKWIPVLQLPLVVHPPPTSVSQAHLPSIYHLPFTVSNPLISRSQQVKKVRKLPSLHLAAYYWRHSPHPFSLSSV